MSNIRSNLNVLRAFASALAAYQTRMHGKHRMAKYKIESEAHNQFVNCRTHTKIVFANQNQTVVNLNLPFNKHIRGEPRKLLYSEAHSTSPNMTSLCK